MSLAELAFACLALLLTPGPTNTLILLSAADRGFSATLRLVPVELLAYLCTIVPLLLLAQAAAPHIATLRPLIAAVAGLWVLFLALRLWRGPAQTADRPLVNAHNLFLTTLLNPKALIFGLVLLPETDMSLGIPLFSALVVLVALVWAALGCRLPHVRGNGPALFLRRAAACWLGLLSIGLFANGFTT